MDVEDDREPEHHQNPENAELPEPDVEAHQRAQELNDDLRRIQLQEQVAALAAIAEAEESFLGTIENLNHQNRRLEDKINEADAQNNLLQMQLRVLNKKMENLENFMITMNSMQEEEESGESSESQSESRRKREPEGMTMKNCPNCGVCLQKAAAKALRRSSSFDREVLAEFLPDAFISKLRTAADSCAESGTNPMMIDLIVSKILSYLPPSALLACRRVNHFWQNEANFHLSLHRDFTFTLSFNNIEHISKYIRSPETSSVIFSRLRIDLGFVVKPFRSYLEEFFKLYGREMRSFSLSCEEEHANRIYTEELRSIFLSNLEKVEELSLSLPTKITERPSLYEDPRPSRRFLFGKLRRLNLCQIDSSVGGFSVWFTKEVLRMAPNLKTLRVETHNKEVLTRILLALGDREVRQICWGLEGLELDALVTQQHLDIISQLEIEKLAKLEISLLTVEVTKERVESLLHKWRGSLKSLAFGDYQKRAGGASQPLLIRLPVMPLLSELRLLDPSFPDQRNLHFEPLSYPVQLPKLRRLAFEHESGRGPAGSHFFGDLLVTPGSPCESLRELRILHGLSDPSVVEAAAKRFPNLEVVHLANVGDPVLKEVWVHFDKILELRLELCPANGNVDSVLTGIPVEVCRKVQERNLFAQVETLEVLDIIRTEPSIVNLKKLRTLRIEGLPSTLLTAVTGYLALSQMASLTSLVIKSDVATISRECRRVLGERLNLTLFELY